MALPYLLYSIRNVWQSPAWFARSCAVYTTWRIWLNDETTSCLKYNVHTKIQADLTCCFDAIARVPKNDLPHPYLGIWANVSPRLFNQPHQVSCEYSQTACD